MHRPLSTLLAKTGLATGIALLLTLPAIMLGATPASADECPEGTAPIIDVDGDPQCVAVPEGETVPDPAATPTPTPTTPPPTDIPASPDPGIVPPAEPTPSAVPESTPAVTVPPVTAPAPASTPESTPSETVAPSPTPTERNRTPDVPRQTATPAPAVAPPDTPANTGNSGAIVPGDGPRLLWAVAAGASASALLAAIVAFYLVSVRPFVIARRRPGAFG